MSKPRHVVFFGASVSEQDVHNATGEVTGHVTRFIADHADRLGLRVSRITAGSSDVTDAALVLLGDVIALAPDLCILDWATPVLKDCDPRCIDQIYRQLLAHDILPVTLIWPRQDRDQRDLPITRAMASCCQAYGLPFHDMTPLLARHGAATLLRDTVHTTVAGAAIYADAVAALIADLPDRPPIRCADPAPFIISEPVARTEPPDSFRKLTLVRDDWDEVPLTFCLIMEQRVGPWSPVLDVRTFGKDGGSALPAYRLWDPWCTRERQALKKLMNWETGALRRIEISVSKSDPPYASVPAAQPVAYGARRIRQRGRLFLITDRPVRTHVLYG